MEKINTLSTECPQRAVRVLQFGEGNFLRAFVDDMLDIANEKTDFNGSVVIVKPIAFGSLETFHQQDCKYTVLLRGLEDGKPMEVIRKITAVSDAVDAYSEYPKYSSLAKLPTLRFVVSNTTEAGIVLDTNDRFELCPPNTYPGKLCKLLFERAQAFQYAEDKGLIILPVELIDDNGIVLKQCVTALAKCWQLGERFERWLDTACVFASTLVDRIVTGYPKDEIEALWQKLGYEDRLLVTGEPFALWVIEADKDISKELPLADCGLPVIFTDNQKPYKQRKVRILNGAHTSFVPAAFLCGHDDVLSAMGDPLIKRFMQETLYEEVIPTLTLPRAELLAFAQAVTERFQNPTIKHALLSICLNSVSKWKARCLPSLLAYTELNAALPPHLTFSLAALMALYQGGEYHDGQWIGSRFGKPYTLRDDERVLWFFAQNSALPPKALVRDFLAQVAFFGQDLNQIEGLCQSVTASLESILSAGMRNALIEAFGG